MIMCESICDHTATTACLSRVMSGKMYLRDEDMAGRQRVCKQPRSATPHTTNVVSWSSKNKRQ